MRRAIDYKKFIYIPVALFIVIILFRTGALSGIESLATRFSNPLFSGFYSAGTKIRLFFSSQASKRDLNKENEELKRMISSIAVDQSRLSALEKENLELKKYLSFATTTKYRYAISSVIARSGFEGGVDEIIIDRGSGDGIIPGQAVISSEGVAVGKILSAESHTARIALATGAKCKLAAAINTGKKTIGIAKGELGLTISIDFIPQTERVSIGDLIVTSGIEELVPGGLVIGRISKVSGGSNDIWQKAVIEPLAEMDSLTIVSVILSK
jgi:rod shape-determining protein MreC